MESDIVERLIAEAKERGQVKAVLIEVGDLSTALPHILKSRLEHKMGWLVDIAQKRGIVQCLCGYFGEPKIMEKSESALFFVCPCCGNSPGVVEGEDITLKNVILV